MNIAIKVALICGAAAVVIGAISGSGNSSINRVPADKLPIASDQARFESAVLSARTSYTGAATELAAGGIRSSRNRPPATRLTISKLLIGSAGLRR
jgi:hypothetical protein